MITNLIEGCWGPIFHKKAHSMKSKERPWVLTKEGPIYEVRRINIKALCMFRFPKKKRPLKIQQNPVKELGRDTQKLEILMTCNTAKVGLRQLKRGTTKFKKRRTYMSFSSIQWCSKEPKSLESDNSWTKGWYLEEPKMKNYKEKWLGKPST